MKHLTREEERDQHSRRTQAAVGLECRLRSLAREASEGSAEALVDFQQFIQYAPQPTRERIGALVRKEAACRRT